MKSDKKRMLLCQSPNNYSVIKTTENVTPKPDEVKLKVLYAGICGSDLAIIHGRNPFAQYPLIPGHEFCGEIIETGSSENSFLKGQIVVVMPVIGCGYCNSCREGNVNCCSQVKLYGVHLNGGFADEVIVKSKNILPVDKTIVPKNAVFSEPLAVGVHCNRIGEIKKGDSVAIIGAGVIGLVILKVALFFGANPIIVCDVIPERIERAKSLGAHQTLNVSEFSFTENSLKVVPGGFDVVFDLVGEENTLENALDILRPRGKLVMVAVPNQDKKRLNIKKIFAQEKVFTASRTYSMEDFTYALNLITTHQVDPTDFITSEHSFDSIQIAFDRAEKKKDEELKVIVKM